MCTSELRTKRRPTWVFKKGVSRHAGKTLLKFTLASLRLIKFGNVYQNLVKLVIMVDVNEVKDSCESRVNQDTMVFTGDRGQDTGHR